MLCERSDHFTGYNRCPVVTASSFSPAPAGARSPIVADDTSVTGVSDRSRNRQRRHRRGINVAIASEVMVEKEVSAKGLADDRIERMEYADSRADHRRGMTDSALPKAQVVRPKVDRKGKGKAIDAYEQAGPSRITKIGNRPPPAELTRPLGHLDRLARRLTPSLKPSMTMRLWVFAWAWMHPQKASLRGVPLTPILPRRPFRPNVYYNIID